MWGRAPGSWLWLIKKGWKFKHAMRQSPDPIKSKERHRKITQKTAHLNSNPICFLLHLNLPLSRIIQNRWFEEKTNIRRENEQRGGGVGGKRAEGSWKSSVFLSNCGAELQMFANWRRGVSNSWSGIRSVSDHLQQQHKTTDTLGRKWV